MTHELETREAVHGEHVAVYSWAPLIIGVGVFVLSAGFVFGLPVGVAGLIVLFAGIVTWVREDMRTYARGSDEHGDH